MNKDEIWFHKFGDWLRDLVGADVTVHEVNGAAPGMGKTLRCDVMVSSS